MDECLPLGSLDAPTLRMLLEKEREYRVALEQEVARLQAGLARQNERIITLERENARLRHEVRDLRQVVAGLTEQNALLRQQVAGLQAENARLRGDSPQEPHQPSPWPSEPTQGERRTEPRKKRDSRHNHGRHRMAQVDERVEHRVETCPQCGTQLVGGWVHRRVQVIDLPVPTRPVVTEHVLLARRCPVCRCRVLPAPPAAAASRVGRHRFGPRVMAAVTVMATIERLPGRQIQERLAREYGLTLSHGAVVGLLQTAAARAGPAYGALEQRLRAEPVVHADETGWREDGVPGYIWVLTSPSYCLYQYDRHRTTEAADGVIGADFGGTLVTDFYAAYDHFLGPKQRCWSHLWRDIAALGRAYPDDSETAAWIVGMGTIYQAAMEAREQDDGAGTPEADRARHRRARGYEQQVALLCPETMADDRPEATLAKRCRRYLSELFTFVANPAVPPTNNAAERSLRPLVIARKISGGTRSPSGSSTRMTLASVLATTRLQGRDPATVCQKILLVPDSHPF